MLPYYVFLDTNIYEESNFSFENGKFTKRKDMTKTGNVVLLYNEVIYREVRQHIESYIKEAVGEYNAAVKNKGFAPFRNVREWEKHLDLLDEQKLIEQQWQAWEEYLRLRNKYVRSIKEAVRDEIKYHVKMHPVEKVMLDETISFYEKNKILDQDDTEVLRSIQKKTD